MRHDITLCLTIGLRPDLLAQTLESLGRWHRFEHVMAINDFRDEATNQMFQRLCPHGQLICLDARVGHHKAVDAMYAQVQTPYVLHCEDDWGFDRAIDIDGAIDVLNTHAHFSQVCLRKLSDFGMTQADEAKIPRQQHGALTLARQDGLHPQWHGYTFNPHIAPLALWRSLGGFAGFNKERHISRTLRAQGRVTAYLEPGACAHLGDAQSVSMGGNKPSLVQRLREAIRRA